MLERLRNSLDPALFWEYRHTLIAGFSQNISIFLTSAVLATALAFFIGSARLSNKPGRPLDRGRLRRVLPQYARIYPARLGLYILPILITGLLKTRFDFSPYMAAVLALGVAYSGFMSETVRAGLLSVPKGHIEAAMSLGLSRRHITWRVVAPQAVRRMLPDALNQYVSLFKATSIVSLIAVEDIMYRVSMVNIEQMRPLPLYTGAALLYCVIIIAASQAIQRLTDGWRRRGLGVTP